MLERLKKVFLSVKPGADVSHVDESTNLKLDLGLDSMALLMLAFNVEEEFGV
ncbi:MAG: acyl carrier protein, partial [Lachnospiraceae bacterium]|nr:acyl carrier protein [Lachnospiraceae bacterium]